MIVVFAFYFIVRCYYLIDAISSIMFEEDNLIHYVHGYNETVISSVCVFESAARNTNSRIVIWASNPVQVEVDMRRIGVWDEVRFELQLYNITEILLGTVLEGFQDSSIFQSATHKPYQLADAARIAIVWKRGGTYSDSDFLRLRRGEDIIEPVSFAIQDHVSIKNGSVYDENENPVQRLRKQNIMNGFFKFPKHSRLGYELLRRFRDEFNPNYKSHWGWNGPLLFTKVAQYCLSHGLMTDEALKEECKRLALLPWKQINPVRWSEATKGTGPYLHNINTTENVKLRQNLANWQSVQIEMKLHSKVNSTSLVAHLMRQNCPSTAPYLINSQ